MPDEFISNKQARYDGMADWYDAYNDHAAQLNAPRLAELLGLGTGLCLDLGWGSGQYFDAIRGTTRLTNFGSRPTATPRSCKATPLCRSPPTCSPPSR